MTSICRPNEAIEHERNELMQIQSMLKWLYQVLLIAEDSDSVIHANVANICARLLSQRVSRLNALRLRISQMRRPTLASLR